MRHIDYYKAIKHGDWIFTCKMQPLQFDKFDAEKNPEDYNREAFTDEKWEQFSKYNDFTTIGGSCHSANNCGLQRVSTDYAQWFIENQIWLLYDTEPMETAFERYEARVKACCQYFEIEFEGL